MLTSCEDTTFRSSVPTRPVQLTINTAAGIYVHFVRENIGATVVVDPEGYHFNGQTLPLTGTDYYGFSGVVIYVDNNQQYSAFDLCCPHCIKQYDHCYIDGCFAVCPVCGEEYDLSFGYATPMKGISKEALRKYTTFYSYPRLTVHD
jgi:nitrite reductase/ring-hydroxylating ferredoxin subunit